VIDFPDIEPRGERPPYRQVADTIAAAIDRGELRPGQAIPSEKDIQDLTGVGRSTARRAIAWLRDQGLARTVPGRGSYVAERDG
jgi:GntR family transcriptional regulator